ncbi:putative 1-phosphatidylinositol-3-phosphate 5-kinase FAB1D [Rutidosis leptorrhynchoides]|uniref:putative 1-phosphatidylinositol-3-phosphate 5-kinase FAB1D n=1 Tax=Rutidosis leptorrhynchoides TaxID=125765 RepID=UPI003A9A03AE
MSRRYDKFVHGVLSPDEDQEFSNVDLLREIYNKNDEVMRGKLKSLVENCVDSSWVEFVTELSRKAASLLKLGKEFMIKSSCGKPEESKVIKGLVFDEYVAHEDMPKTLIKPKLLLIKGSLECWGLSFFQVHFIEENKGGYVIETTVFEMIEKLNPSVIMVEGKVSDEFQKYILEKRAILVKEVTQHQLEMVARFTGSPMLSSKSVQELMQCESYNLQEDAAGRSQPNKPPLYLDPGMGVTILLKGSDSNELERVKCALEYATMLAYHLRCEIPFYINHQVATTSATAAPNEIESYDPLVLKEILDTQTLLVLSSRFNVIKRKTCQQSISRIKFYSRSDVPLGIFLKDNLLHQNVVACGSCNEGPETHLYCYRHHNKEITIQVKSLHPEMLLPGQDEGNLWMWTGCDQCVTGSLKFSKRVSLSDTARSLSFGKFLELGFSNQSSWQVPLSGSGVCDHSSNYLVYFFGLGSKVAILRSSTVANVDYSVALPPWKVNSMVESLTGENADEHNVCTLIARALESMKCDAHSFESSSQPDRVISLSTSNSVGLLFHEDFLDLRDQFCGLSESDFIASLRRCENWDAKGGKSKAFFAKTLDGRFIVKEIQTTEFISFIKFGSRYFKYLNESYNSRKNSCLAKILGIYQVMNKERRETRNLMIMENVMYGRNVAKQYDLKGNLYNRYNAPAADGQGDVGLDQNFVNDMDANPLYVTTKAKDILGRAIRKDTAFLKV